MSAESQIAAEAAHATQSSGGLAMLGVNVKLFIAQLVNFVVVLLVLWKWAYQPIVDRLEARSEKIEKGIKHAEQAEEKMASVEERSDKIIKEAKKESADILSQARDEATKRQDEMIEEAKRKVERVVARGKGRLKSEKEAMMEELREDIADIAVTAAEKILQESVDSDTSRKMAKETIEKMT